MPTIDNKVANNSGGANVASATQSFTTGSGANRYMGVWVEMIAAEPKSVTSVTYHGVPLTFRHTKLSDNENFMRMEYWDLVAPDTGTWDVVITPDATGRLAWVVSTWTDVDQSTPRGTIVSADDAAASNTATVDASSASGEVVVDCVSVSGGVTLTPDASQTPQAEIETNDPIGHSSKAGSTTTTMTWTFGSNVNWIIIAVPLKPASAPPVGSLGQFDPEMRLQAWF